MNKKDGNTGNETDRIEGRNPVLEAYRSGRTVDKLFVLDGCMDGPVRRAITQPRFPAGMDACGSWVLHQGVQRSMKALNCPGISAQ